LSLYLLCFLVNNPRGKPTWHLEEFFLIDENHPFSNFPQNPEAKPSGNYLDEILLIKIRIFTEFKTKYNG